MKNKITVEKSLGKLQIYFKPKEKVPSTGFMSSLRARQLYRKLVKYAKQEQLKNVSTYETHPESSYLIQKNNYSPHSGICVELIDNRDNLKLFCKKHAEILEGRMIVFKKVEFWCIK